MIRLETNINEFVVQVRNDFEQQNERVQVAMQAGIFSAVALVSDRIKQKGTNTAGERMHTNKSNDAYSPQYAKLRAKKGRQTSKVDLYLSGDLSRALQVIDHTPTEATAGFLNGAESQKAEYLEEFYGEIWGLTSEEQTDVTEVILNEIFK